MSSSQLSQLYQAHHQQKSRLGFSILEQERAEWFLQHAPATGDWLDVGCRDATLTKHFAPRMKSVVGVDIDARALEEAKKNLPHGTFMQLDLLGDWSELGDQTFDVILCSEVLEHVYHPEQVVAQIVKRLRPGGRFIGSVPNAFFLKHRLRYLLGQREATPLQDPTHITQFNAEDLRKIFPKTASSRLLLEGYTKPPFQGLAKQHPSLWAYNFLFEFSL